LGADRHRLSGCFRRHCRCKQRGRYRFKAHSGGVYVRLYHYPPLVYCKVKKIALKDILLTGIDKEGLTKTLFYLPLIAVLLPMIVSGVDLSHTGYVLATLLFTLGVGIAEELYFRGIILRLLGKSFGPLPVVFISVLIFGTSHASGAFVASSLVIVLLSILNAFLFGWIAAETALITKNIIPLMIFHCLFDSFTYQMLATGNAMIVLLRCAWSIDDNRGRLSADQTKAAV
jgi:membrane protease YdiL (CAAX protease family)